MTELVNTVRLRAHLGKADALGDALRELVALTRAEPGCALCELHQSAAAADAETWMVYEHWRGPEAFASHMERPYVAKFLARLEELVREPPEVLPFHRR